MGKFWGALNLQGIEFVRKGGGNCKERNIQGKPHNSHPCEFARNGFIQEIKKWNSQGIIFARKGICKERN